LSGTLPGCHIDAHLVELRRSHAEMGADPIHIPLLDTIATHAVQINVVVVLRVVRIVHLLALAAQWFEQLTACHVQRHTWFVTRVLLSWLGDPK